MVALDVLQEVGPTHVDPSFIEKFTTRSFQQQLEELDRVLKLPLHVSPALPDGTDASAAISKVIVMRVSDILPPLRSDVLPCRAVERAILHSRALRPHLETYLAIQFEKLNNVEGAGPEEFDVFPSA